MSSSLSSNTSPELPYIPVMELPLLVRKNILVQADNESFAKWCSYPQFAPLCGTNYNAQEVYEERCKRLFDDKILGFKDKNVSWRDFYYLATILVTDIDKGIFSQRDSNLYRKLKEYGQMNNGTILLNMILVLFPSSFLTFEKRLLNEMLYLGIVETAEWLLKFTTIKDIEEGVITGAYHYGQDKIINFLIEKGITPTQDNINSLAYYNNFDVMKELYKKYKYLPNTHGLHLAIERSDEKMIPWLLEKNIPISEESLRLIIKKDSLLIMMILINNGKKISRREYNNLDPRSNLKKFFTQHPEYIRE